MAKKNISKSIRESGLVIKDVMQLNLSVIAEDIVNKIMVKYRKATPSTVLNATKDIKIKGVNAYKADLLTSMAVISGLSINQAKKEVGAEKIKLMENEESLLLGKFKALPPDIERRLKNSAQLLVATQIADLEKAIFFQFSTSVSNTDSEREIRGDMEERAEGYISGQAIASGSVLTAANVVNEARAATFFKPEVLNTIEAFEFMNPSPVAAICVELAGTIFPKNDKNRFRYTPPLHYNCESWIRPIVKLNKNQKVTEFPDQKDLTKAAGKSLQFTE